MKSKHYIIALATSVLMLFGACSPDEQNMESADLVSEDLVEGIAYSITHDSSNPNIIYLTNLLGSQYTALWEHPQGRSQGNLVTLQMPFAGEYSVTFGVMTRGGVVYGEPTTFTVDDFCADFVNNDLWTYISGGVGNSKKWYLDLDENGVSRYFSGPVYFYGLDDCWESVTDGVTIDGDTWSWGASWGDVAGWQFNSYAMDYGYMEFDLNGGSNVTVVMNDPDLNKSFTGSYMLDTDNHTIQFTDAELLHDYTNDSQVASWSGTMKVLSLNESAMQIAVERTADACLLSFNFISEDYFNNYDPNSGLDEEVTPTLADDWRDYVEPKTNLEVTYILSDEDPFDWCNTDGSLKGLSGNYTAVDEVEDFSLVLNSGTGAYTLNSMAGGSYTGTYTLSSDGVYTFSDAWPEEALSTDGTAVLKTGAGNTLRIMQYEVDSYTGGLTDLWIGCPETNIDGSTYQYMAYHLVPQTGSTTKTFEGLLAYFDTGWTFTYSDAFYISTEGSYTVSLYGTSGTPYGIYLDVYKLLKTYPNCDITITDIKCDGTSVSFDDSIIDRGVGDDTTTARRYILNPWGATAALGANYVFNESLSVTFTVAFETGVAFGSSSEE